ncbi:MFS transporter [Thermoproteus tenax]|uniref:MFS transporter n=1 Tax=Thermoproteus tenax (strain ATCC 35583 / DSM 2078 / JCM 9277 / NBRC 100435 / Kra 1) TaxID=768679 RepID=G4RN17_THETK|nr:MFS transporter [Thermoproteus tenax]CCC80961.1 MFS transporter [Thermoproteus tenax Kra 1]
MQPGGYTIAARLERLPWTSFHTRLLVLLSIGEFFELYDLFVGGFAVVPISHYYGISLASAIYYTIALLFLGAFVGAIAFTLIGDAWGRRSALLFNLALMSLAYLATPFAPDPLTLGLLRFLAGLGVGPEALIVLDIMISEFFPAKFRGRALATAYTISWTAPLVVAALAYFLVPRTILGLQGWQWLFIIGGLGVLLFLPYRFLIPESPRWLEVKGRAAEADKIVSKMEETARRERGELPEPPQVEVVRSERIPIGELFSREYRRRTIMLWIFEFLQTGVYYGFASLAPSVLYVKGFTIVRTLEYTMMIYASYFISSVISIFVIDSVKFDRKWQVALVALLMGVVGLAFGLSTTPAQVVATGFMFGLLSNIFSNAFHQYGAELYPTRIRAFADGVQYSLSRLGNYVWLSVLPLVLTAYGPLAMYMVVFAMAVAVFLDVGILGPRASQMALERLSR